MNINWYPGHMKKTRESLEKSLHLVDIVFEILDARIPKSSRNPQIDDILKNKPRLVILNKSDLSDDNINNKWLEYLRKDNIEIILFDSTKNKDINKMMTAANKLLKDKMDKLTERGLGNRAIRAMIVGVPNVGKSTFINTVSGRSGAKVGNRPGVTKSNQWIKLKGNIELLDTPGILWPKFEDKEIGLNLALTGAIKDEILDIETLAFKLIEKLNAIDKNLLINRYGIENQSNDTLTTMDEIAIKRACIQRGNEIDYTKVSNILLDEFRKGIIGKISLELP